jgi:hypothetical protein
MKPIKMFGLAALAALMAMAFVGASSAMAEGNTALCSVDGAPCSSPITHIHETSVGKAKLLTGLPIIECTVLFLGDALKNAEGNALGNPLVIHGHFTYTSCNNFCSVTEPMGQDALISVLRLGTELADVTYEFEVHKSCPFINCTYNGEGLEGHALGPLLVGSGNGQVKIEAQEMNPVSGTCPGQTFLDLTTTPLIATYISS